MSRGLSRGAHSVHELHYHFVCVTKYRRKVLSVRVQSLLRTWLFDYLATKEITVEEFGAEPDHLHLLIRVPPKVAPAELAQFVKGGSSRYLRQLNLSEIRNKLWGDSLWSDGYFIATTGGVSLETVKHYVQNQQPTGDSSPA